MLHPKLKQSAHSGKTWNDTLSDITGGYTIQITNEGHHIVVGPKVVYGDTWIPEASTQPVIKPRMAILHTNAGPRKTPWRALWNYIARKDVVGEFHFDVQMDGIALQAMPLNRRADCNFSANSFKLSGSDTLYGGISFETQDLGYATLNKTPWTTEQLDTIIKILTCICVVYGVKCTQPAAWNDSGIGHHSLFPYQGIGSKAWTNVKGKTCPGTARIRQMDFIRTQVAHNLAKFMNETGWTCGS